MLSLHPLVASTGYCSRLRTDSALEPSKRRGPSKPVSAYNGNRVWGMARAWLTRECCCFPMPSSAAEAVSGCGQPHHSKGHVSHQQAWPSCFGVSPFSASGSHSLPELPPWSGSRLSSYGREVQGETLGRKEPNFFWNSPSSSSNPSLRDLMGGLTRPEQAK